MVAGTAQRVGSGGAGFFCLLLVLGGCLTAAGQVPRLEPRPPPPSQSEAAAEDGTPAPKAAARTRFAEDDWFLIVAEEPLTVGVLLEIGQAAVAVLQRDWAVEAAATRQTIVRVVRTRPAGEGEAPYLLGTAAGGQVTVSLRWHAQAPFEDIVEGISLGLLTSVRASAAPEEPASIPYWLVRAFAMEVQTDLQPLRRRYFAREALAMDVPTLEAVVQAPAAFNPEGRTLSLASYWLLQALEAESGSRSRYLELLRSLISVDDALAVLEEAFPELMGSTAQRELWWVVRFHEQTRSRLGPILDLERSRQRIEQLALLRARVAEAEREFAPEDLWIAREAPALRLAVAQRLREVKVEVPRINPAYHNALLSLGAVYELVLQEDPDWEDFASALTLWREEKRYASRLQADVQELLNRR